MKINSTGIKQPNLKKLKHNKSNYRQKLIQRNAHSQQNKHSSLMEP
jgi:hypothetical protein